MTAVFNPPTIDLPFRYPIDRWETQKGQTVYRYQGVWFRVQDPFWGNQDVPGVKDSDIVAKADRPGGERTDGTDRDRYLFFGGRTYTVSDAVAAELVDAGFTVVAAPGGPVVGPGDPLTLDLLTGTIDSLAGTVDSL